MNVKSFLSKGKDIPYEFIEEVKRIVGEKYVSEKERDLISYSVDYWLYGVYKTQFGEIPVIPSAVVSPKNTEEVQKVVRLANKYHVQITPFGGGSGVLGAAIPFNGSIILNTQRMNKFISLDEVSQVAVFESGIIGTNLEKELNYKGYSLGNIPQSIPCSTVGGWVSTRAAGQFSTKYGKIEDMLLGLTAVLPDGEILRIKPVSRKSTGPSLKHIFLGSEGTIGIITEVYLSVHKTPEKVVKNSFAFDSVETALDMVREVVQTDAKPAVVRIFDKDETERYFGVVSKRDTYRQAFGIASKILKGKVSPKVLSILNESKNKISFEGMEKLAGKVAVIFISEGDEDFVFLEDRVIKKKAEEYNGISIGAKPVDIWLSKRFDVHLGPTILRNGGIVDTIEVVSLFTDAPALYNDIIVSMSNVKGAVSVSGHYSHFYPESACLYITFAGFPKDQLKYYEDTWTAAMETTLRHNGSISHHHGIGFLRKPFMQKELGIAGEKLMKDVINAVDKNHIFNPGKLVEGKDEEAVK
ncbi:MAG: FAD-binding oxidoreductase [Caldisericota bacterium]|nr:FAD-binding oxidoreductase [Caldisericota bacterium]